MAALHIKLFGGFEARLGSGAALPLKGRKTQALVAYLALRPGAPRPREELVGLLWGDRGEQQARSSLRQSLTELRRLLGNAGGTALIAGRDAVSLDAEAADVDVAEFERLIDNGTADALERAVELYTGDFLDGFALQEPAFEDWLRGERRRLHESACTVLARLLDGQAADDADLAMATAQRLLGLDPLRESAHRALMRLYAGKGERTLALKQYQECRDRLATELGVAPEPETEALAQQIRGGANEQMRPEPLPLPDKPSIAVLPFGNLSGDPSQDYFADALSDEITAALSRYRNLFVISRYSSFACKVLSMKVQDIGRELGVAHILQGSVQKSADRVRINTQLIDAASGGHLWSERYDRRLDDIFAVLDEVVGTIASTLAGQLEDVDRRRVREKRTEDLAAYDFLLLGEQCLNQGTKDGVIRAREMFQRAMDLEPSSARAHTGLAQTYIDEVWSDWTMAPEAAAAQAFDLAKRAVSLDELDGRARTTLATTYYLVKSDFELAEVHFDKALELNPNDAVCYCYKGWCHALAGHAEQAKDCTDRAMRLNPLDIYDCRTAQFLAAYAARRYEDAVTAIVSIPEPAFGASASLSACYAQLGRDSEARQAMADFIAQAPSKIGDYPGEDRASWRRYWARQFPFKDAADLEHLLDGFRKAGLPV